MEPWVVPLLLLACVLLLWCRPSPLPVALPGETYVKGDGTIPGLRSGSVACTTVVHLFHGLLCSAETWRPMMARAPGGVRCVAHNAPFRDAVVGAGAGGIGPSRGCVAARAVRSMPN